MPQHTVHAERTKNRRLAAVPAILVVDADDNARAFYRQGFAFEGWDVLEASDGREALTKALADVPTLVLAEITLPFVDGCALSDILRRDPATADVPILIVTADARPAAIDRARMAGADIVLTKPILIEDLLNAMRRLLSDADDRVGQVRRAIPRGQSRGAQTSVAPSGRDSRTTRTKSFARFTTTTPPAFPPSLTCPSCDRRLIYERSYVGGVSDCHSEQWDYYRCPALCGSFQYRQR